MPPRVVDVPFPFKGYNEGTAHRQQPEGTTPDCLNVRPYDVSKERLRGGQRPGTTKYITDAVNGSNAIQGMHQVTTALDPDSIVADTLLFSDTFTQANGLLVTTSWWRHEGDLSPIGSMRSGCPATVVGSTIGPKIKSNVIDSTEHTNNYSIQGWLKDVADPGTVYILKARVKLGNSIGGANHGGVGFVFRGDDPSGNLSLRDYLWAGLHSTSGTDYAVIYFGSGSGDKEEVTITPDHTVWHDIELHVNANIMKLYLNGVLQVTKTSSTHSSHSRVGVMVSDDNVTAGMQLDNFEVWSGAPPESLRRTDLVVVSGGGIYSGTKNDGLSQPTGGSGAVKSSGFVDIQDSYGKTYFCDGIFADYKKFDIPTFTVSAWTPSATSSLPGGGSGTSYPITAVDTTAGTFTATGVSAVVAVDDIIEVRDSTGNDKTYKVTADDAADTITVQEAIPDSTVDGSIRVADVGCKYMTLYRGRIVMWGLYTDPQNWFMSAVGDALDWDYSPTTTSATMAVAGNNSDAGRLGDVLNCCAPYSDDLMIMGGDHTLWIMRGDPAAGGSIDNISYQTGIAGPKAYAWSPEGAFYFFGSGGLWKMESAQSIPVPISRGRMDNTFGNINTATYSIKLLWDNLAYGLHIFLVPSSQPSTVPTHYFYDARTDSFWLDEFPAAQGPSAIATFDADEPDDRAFLLGGWDSYIRQLDNDTKDDDGTKITSHIIFSPIVLYGDLINSKLVALQVNTSEDSDSVRVEVYAASTAEDVVDETTPKFVYTLTSGRHAMIRQRASGGAIMLKLIQDNASNSYSWGLESMSAIFQPGGFIRRYS